MGDILIRGVSDEVLAAIDSKARRLGLSRSEYLRRRLAAEAGGGAVSAADLELFATTFADLADPAVMDQAWE